MKKKTKLMIYIATLIGLILWLGISFTTGRLYETWVVIKDAYVLQIKGLWLAFPVYALCVIAWITYTSEDKS